MSISTPTTNAVPAAATQRSSFDQSLDIAKSSRIIADHMNAKGKGAVHKADLQTMAENRNGAFNADVSAAAAYMLRHDAVFTAIETHDVARKDDFSGVWNFEWAAAGGLDGTATQAIASMQDAFDRAIAKSAQITEITTEAKTELDASKQRPQN
ncbi:hypothetical protein [Falsirhodobacter halotolerans]|uniref:hypothetical protein n=1 Tax=Falsirhodobacter halotolerans TaxID=1146892 RepID=UPI001FD44C97|nr:hypothetical protein [Falsirhodobacter halotolerans]MCJ8141062.1 hypothetical protein [Falsirhodobacter halotolerans]